MAVKLVPKLNHSEQSNALDLIQARSNEIREDAIAQAVDYAVTYRFSLDDLSQLLVMEGGVDLDTLARIIRENRITPNAVQRNQTPPQQLHPSTNVGHPSNQNSDFKEAV
jgi:hypothetical protein